MAGRNLVQPLLDEANAAFIQGGVSINAASTTRENVPVMARAVGCRVPPSRRTITLLFDTSSAADLLEAVRATKRITAVFSRPSTHQTIQLKGGDAGVAPVQKGDLKLGQRYCDAFVADVHPLGFPEALVRALVWFDPNQLCAVTFTPKEAFLQTPGPRAGEPLKGRADANAR